jgi:hypothetical protein
LEEEKETGGLIRRERLDFGRLSRDIGRSGNWMVALPAQNADAVRYEKSNGRPLVAVEISDDSA